MSGGPLCEAFVEIFFNDQIMWKNSSTGNSSSVLRNKLLCDTLLLSCINPVLVEKSMPSDIVGLHLNEGKLHYRNNLQFNEHYYLWLIPQYTMSINVTKANNKKSPVSGHQSASKSVR